MKWPTDVRAIDRLWPTSDWSIGDHVTAACLIEATAPKLGNVHPTASFADMHYDDFVRSSQAIGLVFDAACERSVGELIHDAVLATRQVTTANTNLGTILLLGPLATACCRSDSSRTLSSVKIELANVLASFTSNDSKSVYEAIRIAKPGGLGQVDKMDVSSEPPDDLSSAMRLAADRDMIAWEYVNVYERVFFIAKKLVEQITQSCTNSVGTEPKLVEGPHSSWLASVSECQLIALSLWGDSLIGRKNAKEMSDEVKRMATDVIEGKIRTKDLDEYLRADGNRRNPGATADLIAAAIFLTLWQASKNFY